MSPIPVTSSLTWGKWLCHLYLSHISQGLPHPEKMGTRVSSAFRTSVQVIWPPPYTSSILVNAPPGRMHKAMISNAGLLNGKRTPPCPLAVCAQHGALATSAATAKDRRQWSEHRGCGTSAGWGTVPLWAETHSSVIPSVLCSGLLS